MFMNIFRITGDVCHLLSFVVMFWKLHTSRSVAGISLKTQELYAVVFCARYLDLFWNWLSYYNVVMKLIFIVSSVAIVYIIRLGVDTYNAEDDTFPYLYLIVPAALLGVAINQDYESIFEMIWAFSIYLEAVAILPQLFMLQKQGAPPHTGPGCVQPTDPLLRCPPRRLGKSDVALHLPPRHVPSFLPLQLGLPLRNRGKLHAADRVGVRHAHAFHRPAPPQAVPIVPSRMVMHEAETNACCVLRIYHRHRSVGSVHRLFLHVR